MTHQVAVSSAPVWGDPAQLLEAFINLGDHAAQSIGELYGVIDIRVEPQSVAVGSPLVTSGLIPGLYTSISVRDNGQGMDAETLARIFDGVEGGALARANQIIQGHQGKIFVKSSVGRGSLFESYLPAAKKAPVNGGQGKHILFLDDDDALVLLVQRLLKRRGHNATCFTDSQQALAILRSRPGEFAAVITDFNMPGMSGIDVALEIRQFDPTLPVILATGFIDDNLRAQSRATGLRELIFKPNAVEEYVDVIEQVIASID